MILEFSVKNYLSFKEKISLSFEATKDKTLEKYFCYNVNDKIKILKLAILMGTNASGKTNILKAIDFLRDIVLFPKKMDSPTGFLPFKFDTESITKSGEFEIIFFKDKIKYRYFVKLNEKSILEEYLYFYPKSQPVEVYKRNGDNINFGTHKSVRLTKKDRDALDSNTVKTMTLLSALQVTKVNAPVLYKAFYWFSKNLMRLIKQNTNLRDWTLNLIEKNSISKNLIIELLKKADFNIDSIEINKESIQIDEVVREIIKIDNNIPNIIKNKIIEEGKLLQTNLSMSHKTFSNDNELLNDLPYEFESDGTKRYFELGGPLSKLIMENHILSIDEIERSLHPDLVKHFINTFLSNAKESQLIVTSHNLDLISQSDEIRKDVIWFTEKKTDGSTELFSLDDFSAIRNNMNYLKAYKAGKLGAVPNLGSTLIDIGDRFGKRE